MSLKGKRVALLIEDEYQELEAWYPYLRMQEASANVVVVGSGRKTTFGSKLGYPMDADKPIQEVRAEDFDAVIIPGGFAPDYMRLCRPMVDFVRKAYSQASWLQRSVTAVGCSYLRAPCVGEKRLGIFRFGTTLKTPGERG